MTTDPVCGMQVEGKRAATSTDYQGRTYYFCSNDCHKTFSADPAKYAGKARGDQTRAGERAR